MLDTISSFSVRISSALRDVLKEGYTRKDLRADMIAGMVIAIIAIPLSMALAIASGLPPQHGLYTSIVAGIIVALLGGSRMQVSGPTASFVIILAPLGVAYGLGGLAIATIMAGIFLIILGVLQMGRLIQFIPYTVTLGFTAGIAVILATMQLPDFMGLPTAHHDNYFHRLINVVQAIPLINLPDLAIGLLTLSILLIWPRFSRAIPAPFVALFTATMAAIALHWIFDEFTIATINSRFSTIINGKPVTGIPPLPPIPAWPFSLPGANGQPLVITFALLRELAPPALAIAMLGAIESLLSAVISDGMTGTQHDPNSELVAQGIGNIAAPIFGGIASTGALARTATNIRSGAKSPFAAVFHSLFVLLAITAFAPALGYLPMASLAALLLVVSWDMSEVKHVVRITRIAPRADVVVLAICLFLTVFVDMVAAITVGVLLASLFFMRRMAEVSEVHLIAAPKKHGDRIVPPGILVYEVQGPLFFGAAQKAMSQLRILKSGVHTVIIDLEAVPALDVTGLVNLESAIDRLRQDEIFTLIVHAQPQPLEAIKRIDWMTTSKSIVFCDTIDQALDHTLDRLPPTI